MGLLVDRMPTHQNSRRGVEYTWGFSKSCFRCQPLHLNTKKELFKRLVRECLSRKTITKEIIQLFCKRTRDYMIAYYLLTTKKAEVKSVMNDSLNDDEPVIVKVEK